MNYNIKCKTLLVILFGVFTTNINAQKEHHNHDHHKYELGLANTSVYFVKEKEVAYGLHLHLIRNINHSKFGLGIGYERIFDKHKHNTLGLVTSYNPFRGLHISLSPGATFEDHEPSAIKFAFHAETVYGFNVGDFHLGPIFEFAYDPDDYHISFGLHIGYGF
ncbi:MAG TPA: hypothetical protein VKY45_04365 [Marinilabiliaceae bacterium]|nr:hypothetical protein [Marinilabiliaceae bacterium]